MIILFESVHMTLMLKIAHMKIHYQTKGTCSKYIDVEVENEVITDLRFYGGCNGNLRGISKLAIGMKVTDVLSKLEGTTCGHRQTSCPDQLCQALHSMDF